MRKKYPQKVSWLMLMGILALIVPNNLHAQNLKEINGVVKTNSASLAGVSVTVKSDPSIGAITNDNGSFTIKVPEGSILVFNSVGYKPVEVSMSGKSVINIDMILENVNLEEVVVIGYGSQKKVNVIGSVSAALPDFTGDITLALHYERRIEFVHEDVRFYDTRRWKILDQALEDATGVDIIQTTNKDNNTVKTTWQQIIVQQRGPASSKLYWVPIPIDEINRAPQLEQNPGY